MIRKIVQKDLSQMLKLWNQNYKVLTSSKKKHTLQSLNKWYNNRKNHEYFGLFVDGKLNGFMILKYTNTNVWIKMLAVNSKGEGFGTKLLKFAVKRAGKKKLFCEVMIENIKTINFFIKHNFRITKLDKKNQEFILKWK